LIMVQRAKQKPRRFHANRNNYLNPTHLRRLISIGFVWSATLPFALSSPRNVLVGGLAPTPSRSPARLVVDSTSALAIVPIGDSSTDQRTVVLHRRTVTISFLTDLHISTAACDSITIPPTQWERNFRSVHCSIAPQTPAHKTPTDTKRLQFRASQTERIANHGYGAKTHGRGGDHGAQK
jgi:hypothetical protein